MACFHPLFGYKSRTVGPSGKRAIVFNPKLGFIDLPVTVPCGQCDGCRLERSRQWAVRCVHEASLHEANCFLTLTYNDSFLPPGGTLVKRDFQLFMKRLRRRSPGTRVRYFHCGEYGDVAGRPHYHCCLFGFDFPDKYQWAVRSGFPVFRSPILEELWFQGQSELGSVTFESAAYIARYVMKKVTGHAAKAYYQSVDVSTGVVVDRQAEYTTMSRRPGLGAGWFDKWKDEVYPSDEIILRGKVMKPPRFYDGRFELIDTDGALEVARERRRRRQVENETPERLLVREKCTRARLARSERTLD